MLTLDFDRETRRQGWEMRMHPSTKRVATLGGFIAGGHAGIGSVNYGILRDRGNILGLKLATIEPEPRILEIRGADLTTVHHAYGVNGVMLEVELPLAPAYPWRDLIITFSDFMQAARFGWALASSDGIVKKLMVSEWTCAVMGLCLCYVCKYKYVQMVCLCLCLCVCVCLCVCMYVRTCGLISFQV